MIFESFKLVVTKTRQWDTLLLKHLNTIVAAYLDTGRVMYLARSES